MEIPLHELSGLPGALGWLALFLVLAGPAVPQLSGWRRFLSAVGMKSMTAYLLQSVLFALILGVMGLAGVRAVGDFPAMAIAVVVWAVIALVCVWLESTGRTRGPFEILLRKAVARSARAVAWPEVPEAPVRPVTEAGPDHPEAGPDHPVGTQ
ncbi:DUF418 domain-containing protein [Schaalia sp. 19OD2882]|uniref:DUF418 domain-containing protein n=1 Tax=Schaalia sp. 19OD2882 TaxID=2794089 RepID=UPI001C1ECCD9|nr:DUF418 domain-containing protein [Schaalia sp. 19OD2882]QWW19327.1 DUF418 domain-containing protein [Schaalia sp. 19OD2882]